MTRRRAPAPRAAWWMATTAGPSSGLVDGHDGYLYGTSYGGGFGVGTIFRIRQGQTTPETTPEILWRFRNGNTIGLVPEECDQYRRCHYSGRQRADIAAGYPIAPPVVGPERKGNPPKPKHG